MLSLFTRRVALSVYRSNATYSRILPSPASTLRDRRIPDSSHHTGAARTFANPQRNASTKATASRTKQKTQAEKAKETAALKRKRLADKARAEKEREKAKAKKEKEKARAKEKEDKKARVSKKPESAYDTVSRSLEMSYSPASVVCASHQASSETHDRIRVVRSGEKETPNGG
jgi:flagellar biosynthesis GTPase FlhF